MVAKEDRLGKYPEGKRLYQHSLDPKKILEFEGPEHAQHLFKGPHKKELSRQIIDFITKTG